MTYREGCGELRLEPLWLRRMKLNITFLYNIVHENVLVGSCKPEIKRPPNHDLRERKLALHIPFSRTELRYKAFMLTYCRLWSLLPEEIRASNSLRYFKQQINLHFAVPTAAKLLNNGELLDTIFEQGPGAV